MIARKNALTMGLAPIAGIEFAGDQDPCLKDCQKKRSDNGACPIAGIEFAGGQDPCLKDWQKNALTMGLAPLQVKIPAFAGMTMGTKKKILLIQTAFLGDVILALPVVQTLKNLMPESIIDFLCIPVTANVLENHPDINRVIKFDKKGKDKLGKLIEVISVVKKEKYDIILCPHRSFRSALLTYFSKAPVRIGFDRNSMSFLLTDKVVYDKQSHEIQRGLDLIGSIPDLEAADSKISSKALMNPSEHDAKLVDALLENADKSKLIAFAPCSKWYTKQLTRVKSEEVIKALFEKGHEVVLIGGAEDFNYCRELEKDINNSRLYNLCGRLSPLQSYAAINRSKALITVDSAAQHLGAAGEVPIVLIYGSTDKTFGFYPLEVNSIIIENDKLDCRPCTDHGRTKCPLGHFKCITELSAEVIVNETENLIIQ